MDADDYQKQALRTEHTPLFVNVRRQLVPEDKRYSVGEATPAWNVAIDHDRMLSRLLHAVLGMITELGELCDPLKRHLIYGADLDTPRKPGEQTPRANMREEIGDKSWYGSLAADALETKLSDIFERNIAKLRARFPDRFTQDQALNRDLDSERKALEGRSTIGLPDGRVVTLGDWEVRGPTPGTSLPMAEAATVLKPVLKRTIAEDGGMPKINTEWAPSVPRDPAQLPSELSARLRMIAKGTFTDIQYEVARELKHAAVEAAEYYEHRRIGENLNARDVREAMGIAKPEHAEWTWEHALAVIRRERLALRQAYGINAQAGSWPDGAASTPGQDVEWQRCADILACENKPETIIKALRTLVDAHQQLQLRVQRFSESL